jgi:uncharacterized protein (TIGR03435 family)
MKTRTLVRLVLGAAVASGSPSPIHAQSTASSTFEVASVRPSKPAPMRAGPMMQESGRVFTLNLTARTLIREAYSLEENQVLGGPSWIDADGFDVEARVAPNTSGADVRLMLRALLAERFALSTHAETRQLPIYVLTETRDGKTRPQIRPSGAECAPLDSFRGVPGGPPAPPPPPPPPALSGIYVGAQGDALRCPTMFAPGTIAARTITMDRFARTLGQVLSRPVVNRTGLSGAYDIDLLFTPDLDFGPRGGAPPPSNAPTLFTALREQLGLRLDADRGPVDVLVIDRIERPTPN